MRARTLSRDRQIPSSSLTSSAPEAVLERPLRYSEAYEIIEIAVPAFLRHQDKQMFP